MDEAFIYKDPTAEILTNNIISQPFAVCLAIEFLAMAIRTHKGSQSN